MVMATRELEQALIEAGVTEETAARVVDAQAAHLDGVATKADIAALNDRMDALNERIERLERTMWRLAMIGVAVWSTTFGATWSRFTREPAPAPPPSSPRRRGPRFLPNPNEIPGGAWNDGVQRRPAPSFQAEPGMTEGLRSVGGGTEPARLLRQRNL